MRPDPSRTGETPVDYGPGFTQREELDILWMTDPRRNWPTRAELKDEREAETEAAEEARQEHLRKVSDG